MKKRKLILFVTCIVFILSMIFTSAINVSAEEVITYDWRLLGVNFLGSGAESDLYYGNGVVNLRCNYRTWDSDKKYLWLISDWSNTHDPASLYLGDKYDMSTITSITFDYITRKELKTNNIVSLAADPEGKNILATAKIEDPTKGSLDNPVKVSMEI